MKDKLVSLIILDGYGINQNEEGNAIAKANKPNLDKIFSKYPVTKIKTSGLDVGLPEGQMGNSEVGHTNIGAGRVVYQELTRITKSIQDGDFFENQEFLKAIKNCKDNNSKLHLYGLLSDGGVHSHITHLYGLLELAKREGIKDVYIHCFLDGRDTPQASGKGYVQQLQDKMNEIGVGKIATISGRFYAMDRDNRWERVVLAYNAMVLGKGLEANSALEAIENSYNKQELDEFVKPTVIMENGKPAAKIEENDSIIFYNYRPDRAREITRSLVDESFNGFERENGYFKVYYVCMTQYDKTMPNVNVAFLPQQLTNTLGEYISKLGYKQLRIAETEKYAHVTFFFNGGVEKEYEGEERALIPSPKVATYDLKPEMSAYEVADEAVRRINEKKYDVMILNFANPDMVGHTGVFDAAVTAIETIDVCLQKVLDAIVAQGGVALVTADHGNAEQMVDYKTKKPFTSHTTYEVPLAIVGIGDAKLKEGRLSDLAPTMLDIMGIEKPAEMTGESLLEK